MFIFCGGYVKGICVGPVSSFKTIFGSFSFLDAPWPLHSLLADIMNLPLSNSDVWGKKMVKIYRIPQFITKKIYCVPCPHAAEVFEMGALLGLSRGSAGSRVVLET